MNSMVTKQPGIRYPLRSFARVVNSYARPLNIKVEIKEVHLNDGTHYFGYGPNGLKFFGNPVSAVVSARLPGMKKKCGFPLEERMTLEA